MVENRTTSAGKNRQRDKELLENKSAKARQAAEMRRQQQTIQGHHAIPLDAKAGRENPSLRLRLRLRTAAFHLLPPPTRQQQHGTHQLHHQQQQQQQHERRRVHIRSLLHQLQSKSRLL